MASLGINVEMVIKAKLKSYLNTLPEDEAQSYIDNMASSVGNQIQSKIDEADALINSIIITCNGLTTNASSWAAQIPIITVPDPMAPKASAASLASLITAVQSGKGEIEVANSQMLQLNEIVGMMGVKIPSIIGQTQQLIDSTRSLLNSIPI